MPTVLDIAESIAAHTKPESTPDWDPVGLQLGEPDAEVSKVAVCHEVTEEVVARVEDDPVDLLVSYHPLLFNPTTRVMAGRSAGGRSYRLVRSGVSLLVSHTDFDAAPGGTADSLAEFFRLGAVAGFGGDSEIGLPAIGRYGTFGRPLGEVVEKLAAEFGEAGTRVTGDLDAHVGSLAVLPGSGSSYIEAASGLADALVTGDVSHHRAVAAADLGMAVVDPGHTATERPGMRALVRLVTEAAGTEVVDLTFVDPQTWR